MSCSSVSCSLSAPIPQCSLSLSYGGYVIDLEIGTPHTQHFDHLWLSAQRGLLDTGWGATLSGRCCECFHDFFISVFGLGVERSYNFISWFFLLCYFDEILVIFISVLVAFGGLLCIISYHLKAIWLFLSLFVSLNFLLLSHNSTLCFKLYIAKEWSKSSLFLNLMGLLWVFLYPRWCWLWFVIYYLYSVKVSFL